MSSHSPLIIPAPSPRTEGFLYLPTGQKDLVIIDELSKLQSLTSWPVWKSPPPPLSDPCFIVRDAPGKGMGMFAVRDIKAGEIIVEERPMFVTRVDIDENSDGSLERAAIEHLSPRAKTAFLGLGSSRGQEIDQVIGMLLSNSFGIDFDDESTDANLGGGVYEFICRANHDCVPATHYHFARKTFTGRLFATRDIASGEEITDCYAPLLSTGSERRSLLSRRYRFDCTCATCLLPEDLAAKSDSRRSQLSYFDKFIRGGGKPSFPMIMEALKYAETEGLAFERALVLQAGAGAIIKSGNMDMALDWAVQTREAFELLEGKESFFSIQAKENEEALRKKIQS